MKKIIIQFSITKGNGLSPQGKVNILKGQKDSGYSTCKFSALRVFEKDGSTVSIVVRFPDNWMRTMADEVKQISELLEKNLEECVRSLKVCEAEDVWVS